jgi:GntR family transcriptional regulator
MEDNSPKYLQIYNTLKTDILFHRYAAGTFLPTEQNLMVRYGASRTTIRRVLDMLRSDGLIVSRQGSGSEVLPVREVPGPGPVSRFTYFANERTRIDGDKITRTPYSVDRVLADAQVAQGLEIPEGTQVYRLQQLRFVDGKVYSYLVQYVPMHILPDLEQYYKPAQQPLYQILSLYYNLHVVSGLEQISAVNAGFTEANFLNVEIGTALLWIVRTTRCEKGPFEYSVNYCRPDVQTYVHQVLPQQPETQG